MQQRHKRRGTPRRRPRGRKRKNRLLRRTLLVVIAAVCLFGVVQGRKQEERPVDNWRPVDPQHELTMEESIQNNASAYPDTLLQLLERNPETVQFVYDYPQEKDKNHTIDLSSDLSGGGVPLFLQWDKRWGYETYGSDMMAITGCGPTCLSMVLCALTGNADWSPLRVAQFSAGERLLCGGHRHRLGPDVPGCGDDGTVRPGAHPVRQPYSGAVGGRRSDYLLYGARGLHRFGPLYCPIRPEQRWDHPDSGPQQPEKQ